MPMEPVRPEALRGAAESSTPARLLGEDEVDRMVAADQAEANEDTEDEEGVEQ